MRNDVAEQPLAKEKWWTGDTVAVVTGANKGIGFEVARLLGSEGLTVVATSRSEERGKEALQKLRDATPSATFDWCQADISDKSSVDAAAKYLKDKYGRVNILVNNAGLAYKGSTFGADEAEKTLAVNLHGTRAFTEAVLPLMQSGDRIVNVCSMAGKLTQLRSDTLRQRFLSPADADAVKALGDEFVQGIRDGDYKQRGFSGSMYGISKACETAYTLLLARQLESKGIIVNAICPGYVNTDMTSGQGVKTLRQGADTPVWVALRPEAEARACTGKFYQDREEFDWKHFD